MALLARILPYYVNTTEPVGPATLTHEEMLAQLRERGLPLEVIEHLRKAPEILDPGEDPDPYGLMKDISVPLERLVLARQPGYPGAGLSGGK
jgi:hypothetical protein